jgi:hypothetical protein
LHFILEAETLKKLGLAIVLSLAAFTPTRAEACSSEYFALSRILFESKPGESLARQAYEMRKSKAYADLDACRDREREEERRKEEDAQRQQAYAQERLRLEQERTRADIAARTQAVTDAVNRQANADLLATISKAILEGRCEDAKTVALTASRLDLADQAMRLCKPATKQSTVLKPAAAKGQQRQPVAVRTNANNVTPSSTRMNNSATAPSGLLSAEPTGQGQTMCFYENQRRLTVAAGKTCPFSHPFR